MADQEDNQPDVQENEDGSATVMLDEEISDVEEQPDGSAIVHMEFKGPEESQDFYANMAEEMESYDLTQIAMRLMNDIDRDRQAREQRDKQYEEGLKRTGLGNDAPGGANFMGASKVVHPVMAEACVDFAARAIKELFPPDGPVRTKILGEATEEKQEKANNKRDFTNWQLTEQIEEFRDEQEQLLTQLPLGGSQFFKMWFDEQKKRPCVEFVPIDNILLPFAAANFYTAQRATEQMDITSWEFDRRVSRGLYRDISVSRYAMEPEQTKASKANEKIEGKQWDENRDGLRRVYHIYTYLELEEDSYSNGEMAPYILMLDSHSNEVLGLYRNWEDGDETMTKLDWIVEFKFIPWRGAYAIGLPHLIGGLSAALTGTLRALLDSAHINNAPTMLKIKGGKISGQSPQIEVTQITEIEGAAGVDDVRKIAMAMPFNPPSTVLYELLGWLTDAAKGVVTTSEEKIADVTSNSPVGTTQALIEQGAAVFSAIHARLHDAQKRVLMILGRINRWHLNEMRRGDLVADLTIKRQDFVRNGDIIPVSDPHIFSETQRIAQAQSILQLATQHPDHFDMRVVLSKVLAQLKVPNINEIMPDARSPVEQNAAEENAAMVFGHHAFAYPNQDHIAHINTHILFAMDPYLGGSPIMQQQVLPAALEHIKQHMSLWYRNQIERYATKGTNIDLKNYDTKRLTAPIDNLIMTASQHVHLDAHAVFAQIMPSVMQMTQTLQQLMQHQQPPMDPAVMAQSQAAQAETQRKAQADQMNAQIKQATLQAQQSEHAQELQMKQATLQAQMKEQQDELQFKAMEGEKERSVDVAINAENNLTDERMKTETLMADQEKVKAEQERSAIEAEHMAQRSLTGEHHGKEQTK
jgi:hypothetical protein